MKLTMDWFLAFSSRSMQRKINIYIYIHLHTCAHLYECMYVCREGEKGGEEKEKKREREGELTAYKALSQTLWKFILWSNC